MCLYRPFLLALLFLLSTGKSSATHYFGVDLFYTHISGNTYRISLVAFGDCSGVIFPAFSIDKPIIHIRQGISELTTIILDLEQPHQGVEVTSGCPADLKRSTCVDPNGTVPGVKKFVYSKLYTLSSTAPDWKFVFLGETDGSSEAGRSINITNISHASRVSVIGLTATLDNTQSNNSSPQFGTIATQFYCINEPTEYKPGVKDADGDSLVYELVPGLDVNQLVTYLPGYSATNPLAVIPGAFNFNQNSGNLSFTSNQLQKSLVVYQVSEYRNGKLLGTCMREMTIIIMLCINYPPAGHISNASGADIMDSVTVVTCKGDHEVTFDINPTDANRHIINMVASGLPAGSKLDISDNNTISPKSRFSWNMPDMPEGDYSFNITYTDDGCPSNQQTMTYTIRIKHDDIFVEIVPADCVTPGKIKITVPPYWSQWDYKIHEDLRTVFSETNMLVTTAIYELAEGKYRIEAVNDQGCMADTTIDMPTTCFVADIPSAFSPNGDGKNDVLYVRGENVYEMHLRIYNRWGQLVFETHDINKGWDGNLNGEKASVETYAYVLSVLFTNSQTFEKQGNITLLR